MFAEIPALYCSSGLLVVSHFGIRSRKPPVSFCPNTLGMMIDIVKIMIIENSTLK